MTLPQFISRINLSDESRLALFDADGTLWENDIADDCTIWMMGTGRIPANSEKWEEYRSIYSKDPPTGCQYLLSFYQGMPMADLARHVETYWRDFMKLDYIREPVDVLKHLASSGCTIWVVTGSPTDFLHPLLERLPVDKIVGMDFEVDDQGIITGRHQGISCAGKGKADKVLSLWSGPVQFAAGNALLDEAMMKLARDVVWAVHPHPELEQTALELGWEIKPSQSPPYGTSGWLSLQEEFSKRAFNLPELISK